MESSILKHVLKDIDLNQLEQEELMSILSEVSISKKEYLIIEVVT